MDSKSNYNCVRLISYPASFHFSIILFSDSVVMEFHGQEDAAFRGSKTGRLYLTTHRMIFNNKHLNDSMLSFSFPFCTVSDVSILANTVWLLVEGENP